MQESTTGLPQNENKQEQEETISELAHRHLLDPNHVTTDEELRNVKLVFSKDEAGNQLDDAAHKLDEEEKAEGKHFEADKDDDDDDDKLPGEKDIVVTPWNVTN